MADEIVRIEADAEEIDQVINTLKNCDIPGHIADTNNPHQTTKEQVGLGNVDNVATKDVLAELVDSGAKNKFDIDNLSIGGTYNITHSIADNTLSVISTGNYGRLSTVHTLPTGKYIFSCKVLNVDILGGTSAIRITLNSSGSNPIAKQVYTAATDIVIPFELTEDSTVYIMFYVNESSTSYTNSADFADIILCTKAAWDISQKYVPHRPSYDELIARVEALEQAAGINTRSVATLATESAADTTETEGGEVR